MTGTLRHFKDQNESKTCHERLRKLCQVEAKCPQMQDRKRSRQVYMGANACSNHINQAHKGHSTSCKDSVKTTA